MVGDIDAEADRAHRLRAMTWWWWRPAAAWARCSPRCPEKCPYDKPQRRLSAGIYHGVRYQRAQGRRASTSQPGPRRDAGAADHLARGFATALLFENIPGGDLEVLADIGYDEDPRGHDETVLRKLEAALPDVLRARRHRGVPPPGPHRSAPGRAYAGRARGLCRLDSGTFALAMGDAHCVVDPVNGQGANSASYSAWVIGTPSWRISPLTSSSAAGWPASARRSSTASRTGRT